MLNKIISSPQQHELVRSAIKLGKRIDGRTVTSARNTIIKTDILSHLPGSSYGCIQYENIEVYVGVKAKTQSKKHQQPLQFEISSMIKLNNDEQEELQNIKRLLKHTYIRQISKILKENASLQIQNSLQSCIVLYVDIFLISKPHICYLQLLQKVLAKALETTQIPSLHALINQVTRQQKIQNLGTTKNLNLISSSYFNSLSLLLVGISNEKFVVDMRIQQFQAFQSVILIVHAQGKVVQLQLLKGKMNKQIINRCVSFSINWINSKMQS